MRGVAGAGARVVLGVVEDLDLEAVPRVIDAGDRVEEPLDDVELVIHGQLHRHRRQLLEVVVRSQPLAPVAEEQAQHVVPVQPVET